MNKKETKNEMQLPKVTVDDIFFNNEEQRKEDNKEKVELLQVKDISNFKNHPFRINDKIENGVLVDEEMRGIVESIKTYGVIHPIIVREKQDGGYEVISGHRRKRGCELAGIKEIPAIVRELTDDEATILMVDSNKQREKILPSEKAFAYKMKLEAEKHQGKKLDSTYAQVGQKFESKTTRDKVSEEMGESREQLRRYIRLTELIPELLELVDKEKIGLTPAVELSYLKEDEQYCVLDSIDCTQATPSYAQAIVMRKMSREGTLTADKISEIMCQEKPNQKPKIKLDEDRFIKILPKRLKTAQEKEDYIYHCVEETTKRELQQKGHYR